LQKRCQLADIAVTICFGGEQGQQAHAVLAAHEGFDLGHRGCLLGVEQFAEAGFGAPQNSEVPTQPVSAVASRTALRHSASARSTTRRPCGPATVSLGVFMLLLLLLRKYAGSSRRLPEPFGAMQYMYILLTL
jgi:hypothetical protein